MTSPSSSLPSTFKRVVVQEAKGPFVTVDVPLSSPSPKEVVIRVEACGVCHSDMFCKLGLWPGVSYPRVPGHEVAGVVVATGSEVKEFKVGDHVGRGWHAYHCGLCAECSKGNFLKCTTEKIAGLTIDGGYQQYLTCTTESLAILPKDLSFVEAGPLMCAGVTVFNALRRCGAIAPALVAVQGIGGLGHLAIQFAAKLGFQVVAISTSDDKKDLATKLGAHHYINASKQDANAEIQKLGGARVLVLTAYDADASSKLMGCLGYEGVALGLGADHKMIQLNPGMFIGGNNRYQGWASGTQADSADTAKFAAYTKVAPMVETFPLDKAQEAYDRMMSNKAKFRVVIEPQKLSK